MRLTLMAERADGYACGKHEDTKTRSTKDIQFVFFVSSYLRTFVPS
jgi:hypothetical protein